MRSLIEVNVESLRGLAGDVEEWEEIEFLVDSGAGATVIGPDDVRAVKASESDPNRTYKLADGSLIPNKGAKAFNTVTEEGELDVSCDGNSINTIQTGEGFGTTALSYRHCCKTS